MNRNYLEAASILLLPLLLGCQGQKTILIAPQPRDANVRQLLSDSTAKEAELPNHTAVQDSGFSQGLFDKKIPRKFQPVGKKVVAIHRAAILKSRMIRQLSRSRLIRQGTYQPSAEHEFPDLYIPAILLGLLGSILLLVGLFTSGAVLLIGAIALLIAFLMFVLS